MEVGRLDRGQGGGQERRVGKGNREARGRGGRGRLDSG